MEQQTVSSILSSGQSVYEKIRATNRYVKNYKV